MTQFKPVSELMGDLADKNSHLLHTSIALAAMLWVWSQWCHWCKGSYSFLSEQTYPQGCGAAFFGSEPWQAPVAFFQLVFVFLLGGSGSELRHVGSSIFIPLEVWSLGQWTTREVPAPVALNCYLLPSFWVNSPPSFVWIILQFIFLSRFL